MGGEETGCRWGMRMDIRTSDEPVPEKKKKGTVRDRRGATDADTWHGDGVGHGDGAARLPSRDVRTSSHGGSQEAFGIVQGASMRKKGVAGARVEDLSFRRASKRATSSGRTFKQKGEYSRRNA